MWLLLALGFLALPFLSSPGRYAFDTHDLVWFHPSVYLARAFSVWRSTPYLGQEQHDGIIVPMATTIWLMRSLGLSAWVAERLWHGVVLFSAAASTILFVRALRGRTTAVGSLVAGLAYALTPYSIGYGLPFSAVLLPYVLLPLLLLVVVKGIDRPGMLWPALFGFVTFFMGGGNGAPQVLVLLTALGLMGWLVFVERSVRLRTATRFGLLSLTFFAGMNAYWLFLLKSPEVFNALTFSEQPAVINVASSVSEAIRGLGFWQLYGGDRLGPWIPTVRPFVTNPLLVLTTFAAPIGAMTSAWLVRWRYRLFFVLLGALAVFVSAGLFPIAHSTPFGRVLAFMYDHIPGFAGLRTTYKATAELSLCVAILAGVGADVLWAGLATRRRRRPLQVTIVVATLLLLAASSYPLWTGRLYNPTRTAPSPPAYWQQALGWLDQRDSTSRALFVPSTSWTTYTWGALKEHITSVDPSLNAVYPLRFPVASRYGSNLIAAVEEPYLDGVQAQGESRLLRYLGVRDVVLQNDIDWTRSDSARPAEMQSLLADPSLHVAASFGARAENIEGARYGGVASPVERSLPPVQVLSVADPTAMIRAEGPDPVVVSGDGFGIAAAARQGMFDRGPPLLYSGALTSTEMGALLEQADPSFVVTDSNRRRVWYFTDPRAPRSYTLPAGQTIDGRPTGYVLFGDRVDTQSVVTYPGARAISASTSGGPLGGSARYRPANAFDRDPSTWWLAGSGSDPAGAWVQVRLRQPLLLSSLVIDQPTTPRVRHIRGVGIRFSDGSIVNALLSSGRRTTVTFAPRLTSSIRLTITTVAPSTVPGQLPGAAVSDIAIPGVSPVETVQVPSDLFDTARRTPNGLARLAASPFTYLFERARAFTASGPDEEARIVRRFEVAGRSEYAVSGTVHLNTSAGDDQIDQTLLGPTPVRVTSSSRYPGSVAFRGSAAFDGDPGTEWVPNGTDGQWLSFTFPTRTVDQIVIDTSVGPTRGLIERVKAVFPDGTTRYGEPVDPSAGLIALRFPPVTTDRVTLFVDRVFDPFSARSLPVGIREVHIGDLQSLRVDASADAPCSVSDFSVDGRSVSVRPDGTVADLLAGEDLPLTECHAAPITLAPGWHNLLAGGGLQPDVIRLSTPGATEPFANDLPTVHGENSWNGSYDVRVENAAGPYYLMIGQNYDPQWHASINGADLGPALLLDGYSAGWRINERGSYVVAVRYAPQRVYTLMLALSGVSVGFGLAVVAWTSRRRRRLKGAVLKAA